MRILRWSAFARSSALPGIARTCALLLVGGCLFSSHSQVPPELAPEIRDKNVMKFKLHYAQGVLEAIATENFSLMATNAEHLGRLTRQVSWRIRHSPEYERLTADFRRTTEALAKAAKNENVDTATVAYFQMTFSCVTCHKYLKGREAALAPELERVRPTARLVTASVVNENEKPNQKGAR